jgi:hypothetical protein
MSTPVFITFLIITSPTCTESLTSMEFKIFIMERSIDCGTASLVLTGSKGKLGNVVFTVEDRVRRGLVIS